MNKEIVNKFINDYYNNSSNNSYLFSPTCLYTINNFEFAGSNMVNQYMANMNIHRFVYTNITNIISQPIYGTDWLVSVNGSLNMVFTNGIISYNSIFNEIFKLTLIGSDYYITNYIIN